MINAGRLHEYLISKKFPLHSVRIHQDNSVELVFDESQLDPDKRSHIVGKAYELANNYPPVNLIERTKRLLGKCLKK